MLFGTLETAGVTAPLRRLGLPLPGALHRRVAVQVSRREDRLEPGRLHDEFAFTWAAQSAWLPDLEGVLRFRIEAPGTRALMHGEYVPPMGFFGRLFDRVVGARLAKATLTDLLARLAQMLEAQYRAFRTRYEQ